LELTIQVPKGLKFLGFPDSVKLMEVDEMDEEGEMDVDENEGESSDSELSECGHVSDIHA
jgi:hypothetical protein